MIEYTGRQQVPVFSPDRVVMWSCPTKLGPRGSDSAAFGEAVQSDELSRIQRAIMGFITIYLARREIFRIGQPVLVRLRSETRILWE